MTQANMLSRIAVSITIQSMVITTITTMIQIVHIISIMILTTMIQIVHIITIMILTMYILTMLIRLIEILRINCCIV